MNVNAITFGDNPADTSGFSAVHRNVCQHWAKHPHNARIDVWAINYGGWPVPEEFSYIRRFYPAGNDWHSVEKLVLFLNLLRAGDYTHLWIMQDLMPLSLGSFPEALLKVAREKKIHVTVYFPVDSAIDPEWVKILCHVDLAIAYTEYGRDEVLKQGYAGNIPVIGHGVDQKIFSPRGAKADMRKMLWQNPWLPEGAFLMVNCSKNQKRKDVSRSLEILAKLKKQTGFPVRLWLHMGNPSTDGVDLKAVANQLRLVEGVDYGHAFAQFGKGHALMNEAALASIYSASDLFLSTTLGEGWGLPITDALACGIPVAIPDGTACREIAMKVGEPRAVLLPTERHAVALPYDNSRLRYRVDVDGACEKILRVMERKLNEDVLPPLTPEEMKWLSWGRIAGEMMALMKDRARSGVHKIGVPTEVIEMKEEPGAQASALPAQETGTVAANEPTQKQIIEMLVKVARAAHDMCGEASSEGTEDRSVPDELIVPRSQFDELSKALDALDALPELPAELNLVTDGPRRADHWLRT